MRKTDILDFVAGKLAPFMFLFGFYLVVYGDSSPGGGFQGGAVISSGVILLAVARSSESAELSFPFAALQRIELVAYGLLLAAGAAGLLIGSGFLADLFASHNDPTRRFLRTPTIFMLNALIGTKVAAGTSLISLAIFRNRSVPDDTPEGPHR